MALIPGITFSNYGGKIKNIVEGSPTNSLLIIGTALDGPINQPIRITDATQAEQVFGPASYGNGYLDPTSGTESGKYAGATIPLAVAQAISAGCQDITIVRASGTKGTATLGSGAYLLATARNPGRIYNSQTITMTVANGVYTFVATQPLAKGGNLTLTGSATGTTLSEFIATVNGAYGNRTVDLDDVSATVNPYLFQTISALTGTLTGTATFSGGTNGCFARSDDFGPELFTASGSGLFGYANGLVASVTGTFDSIRNQRYGFDIAVLTGIRVDDQVTSGGAATTTSIMNDFADFIDACGAEIAPCHGVLAVRSHGLRDDNQIINYITGNLLSTSYGYYNQASKWLKAGPFLYVGRRRSGVQGTVYDVFTNVSVVAGPDVVYNHPDMGGDYTASPLVSYAALLTTIPPEYSATQARLPGVKAFTRPFPQSYATLLQNGIGADPNSNITGSGAYVTLVRDQLTPQGALVINDDVTAAFRDEVFRNYQPRHMCASIQKDIQVALRPFIGKSMGAGIKAAIEAKVENVLAGYALSEGLRGNRGVGYDFRIDMGGVDGNLGVVSVNIELALATAIRQIKLIVNVRQVV